MTKNSAANPPHEVTFVTLANGERRELSELHCDNCGIQGVTHIVLTDDESWTFCSWAHLMDSMRVDGEPLTAYLMHKAGMRIIGPPPEA